MQGMTSHTADDELPAYSEIAPDEGIDMQEVDMPTYAPAREQSWSFNSFNGFSHLGSIGAPHSQMTAVPPSSLDGDGVDFFPQEEDLFAADDNASTQAEGGDRSSVEMMSDGDQDFVDAPLLEVAERRGMRESAPPPLVDDDGDEDAAEFPVAEIRVPDVED